MQPPAGDLLTPTGHSWNTRSPASTPSATRKMSAAGHPQFTGTPDRHDVNGRVLHDCYLNNL